MKGRRHTPAEILLQRDLWARRIYAGNMEQERDQKLSHGQLLAWRKQRAPDGVDWATLRVPKPPPPSQRRSYTTEEILRQRELWINRAYPSLAQQERAEGLGKDALVGWRKHLRPDGKNWDRLRAQADLKAGVEVAAGEIPADENLEDFELEDDLEEDSELEDDLEEEDEAESEEGLEPEEDDTAVEEGDPDETTAGLGAAQDDSATDSGEGLEAGVGSRASQSAAGGEIPRVFAYPPGYDPLKGRRRQKRPAAQSAAESQPAATEGGVPSELQVRQATTRLASRLLDLVTNALSGGEFYARPRGYENRLRLRVLYDRAGKEVPLGVVRLTKAAEITNVVRLVNTVSEANFKAIRGLEEAEERVEARVIRTVQSLGDYLELTERQYHLLAAASLEGGVPRKTAAPPPVLVPEPLPALPSVPAVLPSTVVPEGDPTDQRPLIPGSFKWKIEQARQAARRQLEAEGGTDE
jgi:hypothetical protein